MPDLEPILQDSKYIKPEKLHQHFRPSGKYVASAHYIHVRIPFNFTDLLQTPNRIFLNYEKYTCKWPEPFKTQMKQVDEVSCSCLSDKIDNLNDLDVLPRHTTVTRTKQQFDLVTFKIATAGLTLATYNAVQIPKLESKISANEKKLDHLMDIINLHKQHFKAVDQKVNYVSNQLATMLQINRVHFAKVTDLMEQKFSATVLTSERLIHTAYNHRLAPGAHYDALLEIVKYIYEVTGKSKLFSFINEPPNLFCGNILHLLPGQKYFCPHPPCTTGFTSQPDAAV